MNNNKKDVMRNTKDVKASSVEAEKLLVSPAIIQLSRQASELSKALALYVQPQINEQLEQVQTLIKILKPYIQQQSNIQEEILKNVRVADLQELVNSSSAFNYQSIVQSVTKMAETITIQSDLTVTHNQDGIRFEQGTKIDFRVEFDEVKNDQKKILDKLDRRPTLEEAIAVIKEAGLDVVPVSIKSIRNIKSTITINNSVTVSFMPNTIQSRLVDFFFNGTTIKKRGYELGDLLDALEPDYLLASKTDKQAIKKRYLDVRNKINSKFRSQTGIKADFILLEENKFIVNQDLLNR